MQVNNFWRHWLLLVMLVSMLFGIAMIFLSDPIHALFTRLIFPERDISLIFNEDTTRYVKLLYGIMGAVMAAWMIPLLYILNTSYQRGDAAAWTIILVSVLCWFCFDSAWSAYLGYWVNVGLNSGFLVGFAIPLAATYRQFYPRLNKQ